MPCEEQKAFQSPTVGRCVEANITLISTNIKEKYSYISIFWQMHKNKNNYK